MTFFSDRVRSMISSAMLRRTVMGWAIGLAVVGLFWGGIRWSRSLPSAVVDGSTKSDVAVTFRGTDRSILVSAADTVARELQSFPQHFSSASHQLDSTSLRAKGLFQWDPRELRAYARRWEEIATLVTDPDRPITLASQVDLANEIISEASAGSLDDSRKQILLSTVSMLDSLEGYLEPSGVYRSTWADPVFEQSTEKIEQLLSGFPLSDPTAVTLHVVLGPSRTDTGFLHQSIKVLRDVARRVRMVYPSVEIVVTGSLVEQSDQQRGIEQGLAWSTLAGFIGTSLLAWVTLGFRLGTTLVVTNLLLAGWLVGIMTVRHGQLDLAVARQTLLMLPIAMVAPLRLLLGLRRGATGNGLSLRNLLASTLIAALAGAVGLGVAGLVFGWLIPSARGSIAEAGAISLLCSMAATVGLAWFCRPESIPSSTQRNDRIPVALGRFARLRATVGTSVVVLGSLGIGRWLGGFAGEGEWISSTHWSSLPAGMVARAEANSAEEARRLAKAFREMPTVGRVVEIASWIPPNQPEKLPVIKSLALIVARWKDRPFHQPKPESAGFRQSLRSFDESRGVRSPADQVLVDRAVRIARRIDGRLAKLSAADQDRRLVGFEKLWLDDLNRQFERLSQVTNPDPVSAADLPASLSATLHPAGGPWVVLVHPKEDAAVTLDRFRQEVLEVDPSASGSAITSAGTVVDQLRQLLQGMGLALACTFVASMLAARSMSRAVVAHLPVVAAMVVTAGVLGWLGMDLSTSTLVAWNFAWPIVLVASLSAGWCAISREGSAKRGALVVSIGLMAWSIPMMFAPEGELARIGVTLALASLVIPIVTLALVPGWRAILLPTDDAPRGPSATTPTQDLASTVFFHDAA